MLESKKVRRRIVLIALLLLCGAACGKKVAPKTVIGQNQRGLASWYGHGDGYHGKITANGERFDKNKLTAGHFNLPFGTKVRVHNLQNGRKVVVRINDPLSRGDTPERADYRSILRCCQGAADDPGRHRIGFPGDHFTAKVSGQVFTH